jgi:hypothetical protein
MKQRVGATQDRNQSRSPRDADTKVEPSRRDEKKDA